MKEEDKGDNTSAKAAKRYWEEQVNGLSQKKLILMLYDGAIKFTTEAKQGIEAKDCVRCHKAIVRARDIVTELLRILNIEEGGDVAMNLQRLYIYVIGRLTEANFTKETSFLDNVLVILETLRSAWEELDFEKAAESGVAGNGNNGENRTAQKAPPSRQAADTARLLSVTA